MPTKENPFDVFQEVFTRLMEDYGIHIRRSTHLEPRGFIILNPRNPKDILHMDIFGAINFWNQETNHVRALHGSKAEVDLRIRTVLRAFRME